MESKVVKIHPYDFSEMLNGSGCEVKDIYIHSNLAEVDGVFYKMTTDVSAKTENVK